MADAYDRRKGRTSRERTQQRALEAASAEFADSTAGREYARMEAAVTAMGITIGALTARVQELESFDRGMRGEGGIDIKGNIVMLRKRREPTATSRTLEVIAWEVCELNEVGLPTGNKITRRVLALIEEDIEPEETIDLVTGIQP